MTVDILCRELGRITYRVRSGNETYTALQDVVCGTWAVVDARNRRMEDTRQGSRVVAACESARDTCET